MCEGQSFLLLPFRSLFLFDYFRLIKMNLRLLIGLEAQLHLMVCFELDT